MSATPGALLQTILPQHLISRLIGVVARSRLAWIRKPLIAMLVRVYDADPDEALVPDTDEYDTFVAFFARRLAPGARPLDGDEGTVVSPVDGRVSQAGVAAGDELVQAKDRQFSLNALLAAPATDTHAFRDGSYTTLYLAPGDYHRIHMPLAGTLTEMRYVPGRLFSVSAATARSVSGLYARNERVVCLFDTAYGRMAVVLVGALNVGSIRTVWAGAVAPGRPRREPRTWMYAAGKRPALARGDELGLFELGSTVIVAFAANRVRWQPTLAPGARVRVGQSIGMASVN